MSSIALPFHCRYITWSGSPSPCRYPAVTLPSPCRHPAVTLPLHHLVGVDLDFVHPQVVIQHLLQHLVHHLHTRQVSPTATTAATAAGGGDAHDRLARVSVQSRLRAPPRVGPRRRRRRAKALDGRAQVRYWRPVDLRDVEAGEWEGHVTATRRPRHVKLNVNVTVTLGGWWGPAARAACCRRARSPRARRQTRR